MQKTIETSCSDEVARLARSSKSWLPSGVDLDDLTQETHKVLNEDLGSNYLAELSEALACPSRQSEARSKIQAALKKARGKLCDTWRKRLQRGLPQEQPLDFDPASLRHPRLVLNRELILDIHTVLSKFPVQERKVWWLLRDGYKVHEIAKQLSLDRRRIPEIRTRLIQALQAALGD